MRKRPYFNTLFFQILCTVVLGTVCLTTVLSMINIRHSEDVFVESFSESQEKIFDQIDSEFYKFYADIADITGRISQSQVFSDYLTDNFEDQAEERDLILDMKELIDSTEFDEYTGLNLFVIGLDGSTFIFNSSDKIAADRRQIIESEIFQRAAANPKVLTSAYAEQGFTEIMRKQPVIIFSKALREPMGGPVTGVVFVTVRESDFKAMYSHFTSRTSDMLILNKEEELLSSSNSEWLEDGGNRKILEILREMKEKDLIQMEKEEDGRQIRYQRHSLRNTSYEILGVIRPEEAFAERYNLMTILTVTVMVTLAVALGVLYFVRRQTRPLHALSETMKQAGEGNLDVRAGVVGTREVRQLSATYNQMMEELKEYVERVRDIEKEKRTAEIRALQMQINPHYMYNTLASIKWLALQGDVQRTTSVIDAFISLLRNTISNAEEFVTVGQEIENLKNYVLITQTRYGDNVQVEYYTLARCLEYKVPKLILQPFVENAFFHGFPEGKKGTIQVSVRTDRQYLRFDIEDDGVGMTTEKLLHIREKETEKGGHFTGIGVNNVDNRIKMIYGTDYGINIVSEEDKGTKITIRIPLKE